MRDYSGVPVHIVTNPQERTNVIGPIDYYLRDLSRAIARINKGEVPDGSGTTIINAGPLSDIYLVLLGRDGNQVAHGGTHSAGSLTLASTRHATKGKVYLGNAQQTVYDETNERIGVNQTTPTAKVHIKIAMPGQSGLPTSGSGGSDWSNVGGASFTASMSDNDDSTYGRWTDNGASTSALAGNFTTGLTDPGTDSGFQLKVTARSTTVTNGQTMHFTIRSGATFVKEFVVGFDGNTFTPVDAQVTTSFATYTMSFSSAEAALFNFSDTWTYNILYSGAALDGSGNFDVSRLEVVVPAVSGSDTLQKWEAPSNSNTLVYTSDGNSNTSLVLQGTRAAVSASAWAMTVGSPASGMVAAATDAIGTMTWASASSLATKGEHSFIANGPYKIDRDVDGAWIAPRAGTLSLVRLYRRQPGSGGSTAVELLKNGTTVFSAPPNIAASAGASATASGTISTTAFVAGDRFTVSASAVDTGRPYDWNLKMEWYG